MQNKGSYVVIVVLAFVCLILSLSLRNEKGSSAQANVPALDPTTQDDRAPLGGVSVSNSETKNFLADEYITSFKIVMKDKNKDVAYRRLNESREKILAMLKRRSIDSREYEFSSTSLKEDLKYTNRKKVFLGYIASQTINVKTRSKRDADSLEFDLAGFAFVDDVYSKSRLKDADSLEVAVIKDACKKASKLAEVNASSVGAKVGKVLLVEGSSMVENLSSSDSVEVLASISATLSLEKSENGGKSFVHVTQSENKKFLADKFVVVVNLTLDGADKEMLFRQMGERRNSVAQLAKDLGVAESEIDVESMNLRKKYNYEFYSNDSRKDAFRASQKITVNFTVKDAAGAFMDGVVGIENASVFAARPVLKNADSLRAQVTNIAGQKAMSRARAIAEGFGGTLGKVVSVSNRRDYEFGFSLLGGAEGLFNMPRGNSAPMKSMAMYEFAPPESGTNIADSVSVSVYLSVVAEIK